MKNNRDLNNFPLIFKFPPASALVSGTKDKTLCDIFEEQVRQTPGEIALIDRENNRSITYEYLNTRAGQLAKMLMARGVTSNTTVGIMQAPSLDLMVGILGILKVGAAYVYVNPGYPEDRILWILHHCCVSVLLTNIDVIDNKSFTFLLGIQSGKFQPYVTSARPQVLDFEGIPIPDRSLVDYEKYNRYIGQALGKNTITVQATRGCPYKCAYCHKIWPKRHVVRSAEHIFDEIKRYYEIGVRRFSFIDDIFNLNNENSSRFFELIIVNGLDLQLFFPNGMRGDILTKEYIDLMVEAGTVNLGLALETASPRLQKLIHKNMDISKLWENISYLCKKYPNVILDLFTMHGFPSETKEEAMKTLDFIKRIQWVHFPFVFLLKIYPNTEMAKLAVEQGISEDAIIKSESLFFHQLATELQFEKSFTIKYQADFLNNYFFLKERLLYVLPYQMKILTEDEIVQKYNSYLPGKINNFAELLEFVGIREHELDINLLKNKKDITISGLNRRIEKMFPTPQPDSDALRILLLDLTQYFSSKNYQFHELVEPPLGLMYLAAYLKKEFTARVQVKIAKSGIDFDGYSQLKKEIEGFKPDLIGIRTLNVYRDFFHQTAAVIRQLGIRVPIVSGGPYSTSSYETLLQDPAIDLAVLGEGEVTFAELVGKILANGKKLPSEDILKEIKGIAFVPKEEKSREKCIKKILFPGLFDNSLPRELLPKHNYAQRPTKPTDTAAVTFAFNKTGKAFGMMMDHLTLIDYLSKGYPWINVDGSIELFEWLILEKNRKKIEKQKEYWLNQLKEGIPRLNLPPGHKDPETGNFQVKHWNFEIGLEESTGLRELACRENVPLHTLLLGLYYILLYKLTRQEDIVVGVAIETGHTPESPGIPRCLTPFTYKVAVRNRTAREKNFSQFLEEVKEENIRTDESQDYPIELLMDEEVFEVMFAFIKKNPRFVEVGEEALITNHQLVFIAADEGKQLHFHVLYNAGIFKRTTIIRYMNGFKEILDFLLSNDHRQLKLEDFKITGDFIDQNLEIPTINFNF